MATRAPIKSVNKSATAIATNAAAEKARKAASKRALAKALKEQNDATYGGPLHPETKAPEAAPAPKVDHKAQDAANALAAMRVDYDAMLATFAPDGSIAQRIAPTFEDFLRDQGFNPDGTILINPGVAKGAKYNGPMLALRTAAKSYVKGKNGNPHCNDELAATLDGLERADVIRVLIKAMKLEGNPYLSLNPGQQSMNLRNKARGQLKNGFIKYSDIVAARAELSAKA